MSIFGDGDLALIHGAGDVGWYWHLVQAQLRRRGQDAVAMDLPVEDDSAGLSEYADVVVDAIGDRRDVVVVAQSFGGYTAPMVCERVRARLPGARGGNDSVPWRVRGGDVRQHRLRATTAEGCERSRCLLS